MTRRVLGSEKVREGKAKIPLKVEDPDYSNGEYHLNVEYLENEYYEGSDAFGSLMHVYKTFIHCPTIYVYRGINDTATLQANLFSNNNLLKEGQGNFKVENVTLTDKINVTNGNAKYDYNLQKYEQTDIPYFTYGFTYDGLDEKYREPVQYDNAKVIFVELTSRIPVSIQTYPVMGAKGDKVKLISRVYKTINGGAIDPPKDIPDNGYLEWYIGNKYIGKTDFNESGYSTLDYTITEEVGVYEYRVEYIPTNTKHYNKGFGANTLCVLPKSPNIIHATANIPTTSLGNTTSFNIELDKTECIQGLRLYIDDQIVSLTGTTSTDNYTKKVENSKTVTVSFNIPESVSPSKRWAVEGGHAVFWEYTDTCTGITHYQYLNEMLILFPSIIDFDYIARNTTKPYNQITYNKTLGIPIVTPEIIGHIHNEKYPNKIADDGKLTLNLEKMPTHLTQTVNMVHVAPTSKENQYEVDDKANTISQLLSNKDMGISGRKIYHEITNPNNTITKQENTTDNEGKINNNITLNMAGTWKITTKYDGHKYEYNSNSTTKTITVNKKETKLELISEHENIFIDDTISHIFQLTCQNTPIPNEKITITIDTKTYTATTDNNGKVTIKHKHITGGEINITAKFNETYKYKTSTSNTTVTVTKLNVTITAQNINTYVNDLTTITGQISDQKGENVPGEVTLKQGTKIITTLPIQNGTFKYEYTPTNAGTITYTIEYSSTNRYNSNNTNVKVITNKKPVTIEITPATIYYGGTSKENIEITLNTNAYNSPQNVTSGTIKVYLRRERKTGDNITVLVDNILVGTYSIDTNSSTLKLNRQNLELDQLYEAMSQLNYLFFTGYTMKVEYVGNEEYISTTTESEYGVIQIKAIEPKLYLRSIIDDSDSLNIQSKVPSITEENYDVKVDEFNKESPNIFKDNKANMGEIIQGQSIYLAFEILAKKSTDALKNTSIQELDDALVGGVNYDIHMILDEDITLDGDIIPAGEEIDGIGTIIGKSGFRYTGTTYWKFTMPESQTWSSINKIELIFIVGRNANLFKNGENYGLKFSLIYDVQKKEVSIEAPNLLLCKNETIILPLTFTYENEEVDEGVVNYDIKKVDE